MTEKNFLTKTLTETVLTRRSFLKWSAALGGTAVLAGGMEYGLKAVEAAVETAASEGEWKPAACDFHKIYIFLQAIFDGIVNAEV